MKYLSAKDILLIHSLVIDETGGSHGVRDMHAVLTLEGLPAQKAFGKDLYPTIHIKAALYTRNIIFSHPFTDGNKRTAMTCAGVFLENNGWNIDAPEGEIEKFALAIISKKMELEEIAKWLEKNTTKV